ncbi:MAG: hypothetical protein ACR2IS_03710 [Nitrososphaeraceae archaeon]
MKHVLKDKDDIVFNRYHASRRLRKAGKEDTRALFKTDFGYICSFCGRQKLTMGYTMGVLPMDDMLDMLACIIDEKYVDNIWALKSIYGYLSKEFVHFSTTVKPTGRHTESNSGKGKFRIWGLRGAVSCLELIKPLMEYYYGRLQLTYNQKRKRNRKV